MAKVSRNTAPVAPVAPATIAPDSITNPRQEVRDFMAENGFVSVNRAIGFNTNGYPFVTFIDGNNVAENVYLSKSMAATVKPGDTIAKGFFDPFVIMETTNAQGETRIKLASKDGNRLDLDDIF